MTASDIAWMVAMVAWIVITILTLHQQKANNEALRYVPPPKVKVLTKSEIREKQEEEWVSEYDELVGVPEPNYIDSVEECPDHEVVMAFGVGVVSLYCRCGKGHVLRKVDRWAPA